MPDLTSGYEKEREPYSFSASNKTEHEKDVDIDFNSVHHTIGDGPTQVAAGNHKHPEYEGASGGGVTDHGALSGLGDNDHTQYQLRSEEGTPNGYASLDGSGKVPASQLNALELNDLSDVDSDSAVLGQYLGFNGSSWVPSVPESGSGGGGITDHGALSGLGDDDHPQYLNNTRGDARYINVGGDTMTGNLSIIKSNPLIIHDNDVDSTSVGALFRRNGKNRWFVNGNPSAETGSNIGTNFAIARYDDDGNYLGDGLWIERSTGRATVAGPPVATNGIATKGYVDGRVVISSTAPSNPATGMIWVTP